MIPTNNLAATNLNESLYYIIWLHIAPTSLRCANSVYVKVVLSLTGFQTPPLSTPQSCGCLLTVWWYSFSVWAAIRCCLKVHSSQTIADSLHRMELEHIMCIQMSLYWKYSIEVWIPPFHCWVNRSQLSEDWLLWSAGCWHSTFECRV